MVSQAACVVWLVVTTVCLLLLLVLFVETKNG